MTIAINERQKKVIEITLWMLDQMLCKFERWALHHEEHSVLYDEVNMLSNEECKLIIDEVDKSRVLLAQLRDELGLKKHSEHVDKVIHALSDIFSADELVTIKGDRIAEFGKPSSDAANYLETKITELAARLHTISNVSLHHVHRKK